MKNEKRKTKNGFTLIEILIYSALIALFLTATIGVAYEFMLSSSDAKARVILAEQHQFVRQKIEWVVRGSSAITLPPVGSSGSTLSVNKTDSSENPFVIDASGGVLRLQTGAHAALPITDPAVAVSELMFDTYAFSVTTKNTVRVRATLTTTETSTPLSSSMDFYVSIQ